uniref:Transmembrane protein n=1 Tax=Medicago truncatula TaxID=3880 RepID=B7FFI1_MEDTR|nr:unknown [Medicago truncatula]
MWGQGQECKRKKKYMVQFACWYGGSSMLCLCLAFFPSSLY